ncbi:MAG: DUF433 domain-containing protein [Ardenticatenales bacterium]|nr:DUF433 domain-containing protein [Ardenticatenales bacterium]
MNTTITVQLPPNLYEKASHEAQNRQQTVEQFVTSLVVETVLPAHPYVTLVHSRGGGMRPVVRGTRVGVDVVVGYHQAGYTPEQIAAEMLPQLHLAQVYDALSYYEERRELLDAEMLAHTAEAWQDRLMQEMGPEAAAALLGA